MWAAAGGAGKVCGAWLVFQPLLEISSLPRVFLSEKKGQAMASFPLFLLAHESERSKACDLAGCRCNLGVCFMELSNDYCGECSGSARKMFIVQHVSRAVAIDYPSAKNRMGTVHCLCR